MPSKTKILKPGRRKSSPRLISEELSDTILADICGNTMKVGDLLGSERNMASQHSVGRITIRTALKKLARMGYLKCIPGVGYRITCKESKGVEMRPIGLIYSNIGSSLQNPLDTQNTIENLLAREERALLVGSSCLKAEMEDACIRRFKEAAVAGLIVTPAVHGERSAELESWISAGGAVVLEGHAGDWLLPDKFSALCDQVDTDNAGGIKVAMDYLMELGHRKIACFSSGKKKGSELISSFESIVREQGLPFKPEWLQASLKGTRESGMHLYHQIMSGAEECPTAVICLNEDLALGMIDAGYAAGCPCPDFFSVLSFRNKRESADFLTLVETSEENVTGEIVRLLNEQLSGRRSPVHLRIPFLLLKQGSCSAPHEKE